MTPSLLPEEKIFPSTSRGKPKVY